MGDEIESTMETPESQSDDSADQEAADRAEGADPYAEGDSRNEGEAQESESSGETGEDAADNIENQESLSGGEELDAGSDKGKEGGKEDLSVSSGEIGSDLDVDLDVEDEACEYEPDLEGSDVDMDECVRENSDADSDVEDEACEYEPDLEGSDVDMDECVRENGGDESAAGPEDNFGYAAEIVGGFEGNYDSVQRRDVGIVSYGRYQFTLRSGNLGGVLRQWLDHPDSNAQAPDARRTIVDNLGRVNARDEGLQNDQEFRDALVGAGQTPSMQEAQDNYERQNFFEPAVRDAAEVGVQSRVGQAIFFDTRNQGGLGRVIRETRDALGGRDASEVGERVYLNEFLNQRAEFLRGVSASHAQRAQELRQQTAQERNDGNENQAMRLEQMAGRYQANSNALGRAPQRRIEPLRERMNSELPER